MGRGIFPLGACFDQNTFGISIRDGLWYLSGVESEVYSNARGRSWIGPTGYDFNTFVTKLVEAAGTRWPQLLFGRTEEIELFLKLDDPRLTHLQEYVRRLRQTKNIMACSDAEVRSYADLPASDLDPVSGEAVHEWFHQLTWLKQSWSTLMGRKLFDLLEPHHWTLQDEVTDVALTELWMNRYLSLTDKVLRTLDDESAGVDCSAGTSLREAAGVEDDREEVGLLFIPDQPGESPFFIEASSDQADVPMEVSGRVLAFANQNAPRLPDDRSAFQYSPMDVPFDVLAAAEVMPAD